MPGFRSYRLKGTGIGNARVVSLSDLALPVGSSCDNRPVVDYFHLLPAGVMGGNIGGSIAIDRGPLVGNTPPVSGAEVVLLCAERGSKRPCRTTTSDSRGQFMFKGLLPGTYDLLVNRLGYYPELGSSYDVHSGIEAVYYPIHLERCVNRKCDSASRPKHPVQLCE